MLKKDAFYAAAANKLLYLFFHFFFAEAESKFKCVNVYDFSVVRNRLGNKRKNLVKVFFFVTFTILCVIRLTVHRRFANTTGVWFCVAAVGGFKF